MIRGPPSKPSCTLPCWPPSQPDGPDPAPPQAEPSVTTTSNVEALAATTSGALLSGQTLPQVWQMCFSKHHCSGPSHCRLHLRTPTLCLACAGHAAVLYRHGRAADHAERWQCRPVSAPPCHWPTEPGLLVCLVRRCHAQDNVRTRDSHHRHWVAVGETRCMHCQVQHHQGASGGLQRCERHLAERDIFVLAPASLSAHHAVGET